jgi:hypothetical protein
MTASFTAHDILDFLEQSTYRRGKVQNATLTALATDILDDAGITDYNIDTALTSITVGGNIPICSHREALQYVAVAGQAVVYVDRDNVVQIKQLDTVAEDDFIDFDNVYDKPKIVLDKLVNTVEVPVSNYTLRGASEEVFNGVIYVNGTENIWIEYESAPCASVTALASGGTLNSATYYGNGALLNLTGTGNITVTATGKVYDVSNTPYSLLDGTAPAGEATLQLKVSNPLLTSISLASDVAQWILDEKKKRFIYEINWRGNPAHECCDIIPVEDIYGQNLDVRLTKNELSFDGTLRAKTSGRGA